MRCPNCGSEAVEEAAAVRRRGGSLAYLVLGVITGALFFGLAFVVFFVMGYGDRFVFPFIEYSPFLVVFVLATIITWMAANRIGRSLLAGPAPAAGMVGEGGDSAPLPRRHCMVCNHTWMKGAAA